VQGKSNCILAQRQLDVLYSEFVISPRPEISIDAAAKIYKGSIEHCSKGATNCTSNEIIHEFSLFCRRFRQIGSNRINTSEISCIPRRMSALEKDIRRRVPPQSRFKAII